MQMRACSGPALDTGVLLILSRVAIFDAKLSYVYKYLTHWLQITPIKSQTKINLGIHNLSNDWLTDHIQIKDPKI